MINTKLSFSAILLALSVSGCNSKERGDQGPNAEATSATSDAASESTSDAMVAEVAGDATANCPMTSSDGWTANLSSVSGPKETKVLTVSGTVNVNTSGYKAILAAGATMEKQPPIQQMILTVTPPKPGAVTMQVRSHLPVKSSIPDAYPAYSAVEITCGGKRVALIKTIESGE